MQKANDFSTKDNKIYIKGITLGDNESLVTARLGNPNSKEEDGAGDFDYLLKFNNLIIGINQNTVGVLIIETNKDSFIDEFSSIQVGEKYKDEQDRLYLYIRQSEQVLYSQEDENKMFRAYLTYKDNNIDFSPNNRTLTKLD
ncbi:hypothetical protein NQ109_29535 [Priestia megaterium]|uniref:hypothetical protein n=1 Tax=Priestia megaterium TaxID=1404 RepID=UPI000BF48BBD|nr:hypothetical protein [Priestia megaterium]MCR8867074.1 hypothetical protein [Priestia megaterium]PFU61805.1 hypothetical protein COK90_11585 [Priestia megaterium]